KRVGFSGYPELQKELRRILQGQLVPMKKLRQSVQDIGEEEMLVGRVIEVGAESLSRIYNKSLERAFSSATDAICSADRLIIVGMRSSFAVAYYLSFMLGQFMANVRLVSSGTEDAFDQIVDIDSEDVFFAVSFPRYTRRTADMAGYAKRAGAKVISLTDTMASVLVPMSDIVLLAPNLSPFYSFVAPMAIADALIVAVGKRFKDRVGIALDKREKALMENGIYV
ncbi:MAG: MurR/RpiR family transcriptional regulator, partial [Bacillota bacterium]